MTDPEQKSVVQWCVIPPVPLSLEKHFCLILAAEICRSSRFCMSLRHAILLIYVCVVYLINPSAESLI